MKIDFKSLPINDFLAQYVRKLEELKSMSEEEKAERKAQMQSCNHLFVKIMEGKHYYYGFHSADYTSTFDEIECLCCGMTNKFKFYEGEPVFSTFGGVKEPQTFCDSFFNLISIILLILF